MNDDPDPAERIKRLAATLGPHAFDIRLIDHLRGVLAMLEDDAALEILDEVVYDGDR